MNGSSLGGNLTATRQIAGRSSSQISIYDYPEHLNPFYEDEQHKRLRFWHIGKKGNNKTSRSNSFSLDGIRDMWSLKSFRRTKKKDSVLGINKTSESPPPLRRQIDVEENTKYSTYDPKMRHTVTVGLNSSFPRGAGYRSSLQNMNDVRENNKEIGLIRNDRYRSSVQNGYSRESTPPAPRFSGSTTPRSKYLVSKGGMTSGHSSSQVSVNSTNPFDDEDTESVLSGGSTATTPGKRPVRKKKRAPPPPPSPVPKITRTSPDDNSIELKIEENAILDDEEERRKIAEISNLTAEIETFVKQTNSSPAREIVVEGEQEKPEVKPNQSSPVRDDTAIKETTVNTIVEVRPENPPKKITEEKEVVVINPEVTVNKEETQVEVRRGIAIGGCIRKKDEIIRDDKNSVETPQEKYKEKIIIYNDVETIDGGKSTDKNEVIKEQNTEIRGIAVGGCILQPQETTTIKEQINNKEEIVIITNNLETKSTQLKIKAVESPKLTPKKRKSPPPPPPPLAIKPSSVESNELRITESKEDLPDITKTPLPTSESDNADPYKNVVIEMEKFEIRFVPLKDSIDSEDGNVKVNLERKRSVKEIIESINKSQSLLKFNHEDDNRLQGIIENKEMKNIQNGKNKSNDSLNRNIKELEQQEKEINQLIKEMQNDVDEQMGDIPLVVQEFNNNNYKNTNISNENNMIFEKCVKLRKHDENLRNKSNIEWNPVPKPRRSRNLSTEQPGDETTSHT